MVPATLHRLQTDTCCLHCLALILQAAQVARLEVLDRDLPVSPDTPRVVFILETHNKQCGQEGRDAHNHAAELVAVESRARDLEYLEALELAEGRCGVCLREGSANDTRVDHIKQLKTHSEYHLLQHTVAPANDEALKEGEARRNGADEGHAVFAEEAVDSECSERRRDALKHGHDGRGSPGVFRRDGKELEARETLHERRERRQLVLFCVVPCPTSTAPTPGWASPAQILLTVEGERAQARTQPPVGRLGQALRDSREDAVRVSRRQAYAQVRHEREARE